MVGFYFNVFSTRMQVSLWRHNLNENEKKEWYLRISKKKKISQIRDFDESKVL